MHVEPRISLRLCILSALGGFSDSMLIVDPGGLHSHVDIGSAGAIAQRETLLGTAGAAA